MRRNKINTYFKTLRNFLFSIYNNFQRPTKQTQYKHTWNTVFFVFFSVRLLSVLRDHLFFSSPPQRPMTSDFEAIISKILSITYFVLSLSERASISLFNVEWTRNYWYHFITSLVLTRSALEASTLPLGYRWGGT